MPSRADRPEPGFPPEEFVARRSKLFDRIGREGCALLQGAGPVERSEPFRQTNEFHYLCGVEAPQAYLLLDGRDRTTTLGLPRRDERQERSAGPGWAAEDAGELRERTGAEAVCATEELPRRLEGVTVLYTPHSPAEGRAMYRDELRLAAQRIAADPWDAAPSREARFLDRLRARCESLEIRDLSPLLDELRLIKSPREIERMRRAGRLTALGVSAAMRCTRPGVREYQLAAVAQYLHRVNGADGEGYCPIVAGGANIWFPHYHRNDGILADRDMVLMDYAPDCDYYTSDIGRIWPVNGRYSPWQRELVGFMTRYHQALLTRIRPGVLPAQILEEAAAAMARVIEANRFSKPVYEQAARRTLTFRGHLSHPVGMAVHDVGSYWDRPLAPGLVFSVDPQMWVPEEKLYVRVEDTVAVTDDGIENLTARAPLELDEIEALVGQSGMLQRYPAVE
jgi:Xaa-Pro aminopeptidase